MSKRKSDKLKGCRIGIELVSGERLYGKVHKWDKSTIWIIKDGYKKPVDVPKDIIVRSFVLLLSEEE